MSGPDIVKDASDGIREASAATGDGTPLVGTIIRPGDPDESTYPVTPGVPQEFKCWPLWSSYSAMDRDGSNITITDVKAIITADSETDPRNGDQLKVKGVTYNLNNVTAINKGGVVLYWTATARKG